MPTIRKQKALKKINRKVILNILRNSGEVSISELSKKVNLSKPTLMNIMNYYIFCLVNIFFNSFIFLLSMLTIFSP